MRLNEFDDRMVPRWAPYDENIPADYWMMPIRVYGQVVLPYEPKNSWISINQQTIADLGSDFEIQPLGMGDGWFVQFDCRSSIIVDAPDYKKAQDVLKGLEVTHWDDKGKIIVDDKDIEEIGSVISIGNGRVMRLNKIFKEDNDED
jgi:hypothetical protein